MGDPFNKQDLRQNVQDATKAMEEARAKYNRVKVCLECIEDCSRNSSKLSPALRQKVKNILLTHRCAKALPLESAGFGTSSLLGKLPLEKPQLTYEEKLQLSSQMKQSLESRSNDLRKELDEIIGHNIKTAQDEDTLELKLNNQDFAYVDIRNQLLDLQKSYLGNLQEEQTLLEDTVRMRTEKIQTVSEEKLREVDIVTDCNLLKTKIIEAQSKISMFTQNEHTLPAFEEVLVGMQQQQKQYERDIKELEELKEQYKNVDCQQYRDLLKSYIVLENSIGKLKHLLPK